MAVKPRERVESTSKKTVSDVGKLSMLASYLSTLRLPDVTSQELLAAFMDVAFWLASVVAPAPKDKENYKTTLKAVKNTVHNVMSSINPKMRREITTGIRQLITPCAANSASGSSTHIVCTVLNILPDSAAFWLLEEMVQSQNDLKSTLHYMYRMLYTMPTYIPVNRTLVMAFVQDLIGKQMYGVLIPVSREELRPMFVSLADRARPVEHVAPVCFYLLHSMRKLPRVLDTIASDIPGVLERLTTDSSRTALQELVDITLMLYQAQSESKQYTYHRLKKIIDDYQTPATSIITQPSWTQLEPWSDNEEEAAAKQSPTRNGLVNMGNQCFFNSTMQALLSNTEFSSYALSGQNRTPMWQSLSKVLACMLYAVGPVVDVSPHIATLIPPAMNDGHQHDCSEFLMLLMGRLHIQDTYAFRVKAQARRPGGRCLRLESSEYYLDTAAGSSRVTEVSSTERVDVCDSQVVPYMRTATPECARSALTPAAPYTDSSQAVDLVTHNRPAPPIAQSSYLKRPATDSFDSASPKNRCNPDESMISQLYSGVFATRRMCLNCGNVSVKEDIFREVQLPLPEKIIDGETDVQKLMAEYCRPERLTGDNKYKCEWCRLLCEAEQTVLFAAHPQYLVLVLKRFYYDPKLQDNKKILNRVIVNTTLSLPFITPIVEYELMACVIHSGSRSDMGHYYTVAKHETWYRFNDGQVTQVSDLDAALSQPEQTPYILFYRRTPAEQIALPQFHEVSENLQASVRQYEKEVGTLSHKMRRPRARLVGFPENLLVSH